MEKINVKPSARGLKVRFENPGLGFIPEKGAPVERTRYIRRLLRDRDLVMVQGADHHAAHRRKGE